MKPITYKTIALLLILSAGCKKQDQPYPANPSHPAYLSLTQARAWISRHPDSIPKNPNWAQASFHNSQSGTSWQIPVEGTPQMNRVKGHTKLLIHKDKASGSITARLLDYVPDGIYLQTHPQSARTMTRGNTFTGRIYARSLGGKLLSGYLVYEGKRTGLISPDTSLAGKSRLQLNPQIPIAKSSNTQQKTSLMDVQEMIYYTTTHYVDGDGVFTVHSEAHTIHIVTFDGYNDYPGLKPGQGDDTWNIPTSGSNGAPSSHGSGVSGNNEAQLQLEIPDASDLPGELAQPVDPRKMMDCFNTINNPNAAYTLRVHVQEPFPGTSFNIGPNSYGHVAIELSKTSGGQTITQVIGYYPTGSGFEKMVSTSRLVDNGDMAWDVSASYNLSQEDFNKVTQFAASPPKDYHFQNYNCVSFAVDAARRAGVDIPSGTTSVGIGGPGGVMYAQTPAGLGSALRQQRTANPALNISTGGGNATASKGECR